MKTPFAHHFRTAARAMMGAAMVILGLSLPNLSLPQAEAQTRSLFDPVVVVDGRPVTLFELDQRLRFLRILGVSGDLQVQAEAALIDERLQLSEAQRLGIGLTNPELQEGLAEFAGRAGLGTEDFIRAIGEAGIAPQTFRDFVQAGLLWRKVVRARLGRQAGAITEAEVDRELSLLRQGEGVIFTLSEIVLPATEAEAAAELAANLATDAAFAEAARNRSIVPSAVRGGRLGSVPAAYLGQQAAQVLTALPVGGVSPPLRVPEGVVIYRKHGAEPFAPPSPRLIEVDLITLDAPDADDAALMAAAGRLRGQIPDCGRMQADAAAAVADLLPNADLRRTRSVLADLPGGVVATLAGLDAGEVGANLRQGPGRGVIILCARRLVSGLATGLGVNEEGDAARVRTAIRDTILNRRLMQGAELYLADLRANARIERP